MNILKRHKSIPPVFTSPAKDIKSHRSYVEALGVNPESSDDSEFEVLYVYCSRHLTIHTTGWCSYLNVYKVPLYSDSIGYAQQELAALGIEKNGN